MPLFDTNALRHSLPFSVSDDELVAFEPSLGTSPAQAGWGCGNVVCRYA
jgi:hypothetical protein